VRGDRKRRGGRRGSKKEKEDEKKRCMEIMLIKITFIENYTISP